MAQALAKRCQTNGYPSLARPFHQVFHSSNDSEGFLCAASNLATPLPHQQPEHYLFILQKLNKAVTTLFKQWFPLVQDKTQDHT